MSTIFSLKETTSTTIMHGNESERVNATICSTDEDIYVYSDGVFAHFRKCCPVLLKSISSCNRHASLFYALIILVKVVPKHTLNTR